MSNAIEVKHFDANSTGATVTSAGTITKLSTIAQGAVGNQRVGDEARLAAISLRAAVWGNTTAVRNAFRLIILQWNLDDGTTAPTLAAVLQGGLTDAPYNWESMQNGEMRILYDELLVFDAVGGPSGAHVTFERVLDGDLSFNTSATTGTGMIYLCLVSDQAANGVNLRYFSRLLYTDQ